MNLKKIKLAACVLVIAFSSINCGCAYTVKRTNFNPIEANGWKPLYNSKAGQSRLFYKCGSFQIEAHFVPITDKTYSIGPILPVIPIYDEGMDNSKKMLKIEIVLDGSLPNNILSEKSIVLIRDKDSPGIKTQSFNVSYGRPQEREYYDFGFAIAQKAVREFTIIFPEALAGCLVPPLKYEYTDLGLRYDVLAN